MEGGEDVALFDPISETSRNLNPPVVASHRDKIELIDAKSGGVIGMNLEPVALHQLKVPRAARHRAGVVVLQAAAGNQDQRELLVGNFAWLAVRQRAELAKAVVVDERFGVKNLCIAAVPRAGRSCRRGVPADLDYRPSPAALQRRNDDAPHEEP